MSVFIKALSIEIGLRNYRVCYKDGVIDISRYNFHRYIVDPM